MTIIFVPTDFSKLRHHRGTQSMLVFITQSGDSLPLAQEPRACSGITTHHSKRHALNAFPTHTSLNPAASIGQVPPFQQLILAVWSVCSSHTDQNMKRNDSANVTATEGFHGNHEIRIRRVYCVLPIIPIDN